MFSNPLMVATFQRSLVYFAGSFYVSASLAKLSHEAGMQVSSSTSRRIIEARKLTKLQGGHSRTRR